MEYGEGEACTKRDGAYNQVNIFYKMNCQALFFYLFNDNIDNHVERYIPTENQGVEGCETRCKFGKRQCFELQLRTP